MAASVAARRGRRFWDPRGGPSPLRAFATIIPKVSQVDNSSDFLGNVPHRRHPGVLHLKSVQLPAELVKAAQLLVEQSSVRGLKEQVVALTNYLWSRKRPPEARELQQRGQDLEQRLREEIQAQAADLRSPWTDSKEQRLQQKVLSRLRKTTYHWEALRYTEELSLVYMAARLAGGFAAVSRALHEIRKREPAFAPRTLLDFGSGTGSVSWSAREIWGQSLREYVCVDTSAPMLALAERLLQGGSKSQAPLFGGVHFRQFLPVSPKVRFDLVVSAFSLQELPSLAERRDTVRTLWRKTDGFLVLVENGTKEGHQILMEAREIVLGGGDKVTHDPREAHVFAPCPHHLPCPRLNPERPLPCNYLQKYHPLPFRWNPPAPRGELFSFLVLRRGRGPGGEPWPRITQTVLARARHVHCHLCCPDGQLQHALVTARRHGRDLYRCARLSHWGDRLPVTTPAEEATGGAAGGAPQGSGPGRLPPQGDREGASRTPGSLPTCVQ